MEPSDKMVTRQEITVLFPYNRVRNCRNWHHPGTHQHNPMGAPRVYSRQATGWFHKSSAGVLSEKTKGSLGLPCALGSKKTYQTPYIGGYVVPLSCWLDLSRALAGTLISSEQQWLYGASTQVVSVEAECGRCTSQSSSNEWHHTPSGNAGSKKARDSWLNGNPHSSFIAEVLRPGPLNGTFTTWGNNKIMVDLQNYLEEKEHTFFKW